MVTTVQIKMAHGYLLDREVHVSFLSAVFDKEWSNFLDFLKH